MAIRDATARNLEERVQVLLGIRGKAAEHAVRRGELEKLVNQIINQRLTLSGAGAAADENENGNFVRFDNGFQYCWQGHIKLLAIDVAFQGQYRTAEQIWEFPVPFVQDRTVKVSVQAANNSAAGSVVRATNPLSCRYSLTNATTQTEATRIAHLSAAGWWR